VVDGYFSDVSLSYMGCIHVHWHDNTQALHDAGLSTSQNQLSESDRDRVGVAVGAGMSCTTELAAAGVLLQAGQLRRLSPYFIPRVLVNTPAAAISMAHGLKGPLHAASTACATGAHAVGDAFRMIQCGDAEVMVCGGTEACIDAVSLGGFSRLRALSTRFNDEPHLASRWVLSLGLRELRDEVGVRVRAT